LHHSGTFGNWNRYCDGIRPVNASGAILQDSIEQDMGMSRRGFDLIVCVGSLCLIGYLLWHAVHGQRSFSQAERIQMRIATLTEERDKVRAERMALDKRVALLRPESIDPDLLEELARTRLGFVRPNDVLIDIR
jgi:cell division protein FtsB